MSGCESCPHCGASMQGEPVPDEYRQHKPDHDEQVARLGRCYCLPYGETTHFSRAIGHEIRGVYDGVLFWSCPDCHMAWPRWTDGPRGDHSTSFVAQYNALVVSP